MDQEHDSPDRNAPKLFTPLEDNGAPVLNESCRQVFEAVEELKKYIQDYVTSHLAKSIVLNNEWDEERLQLKKRLKTTKPMKFKTFLLYKAGLLKDPASPGFKKYSNMIQCYAETAITGQVYLHGGPINIPDPNCSRGSKRLC